MKLIYAYFSLSAFMTGAGYLINMNDIAGPYAGIIFGISNTFATVPGMSMRANFKFFF